MAAIKGEKTILIAKEGSAGGSKYIRHWWPLIGIPKNHQDYFGAVRVHALRQSSSIQDK